MSPVWLFSTVSKEITWMQLPKISIRKNVPRRFKALEWWRQYLSSSVFYYSRSIFADLSGCYAETKYWKHVLWKADLKEINVFFKGCISVSDKIQFENEVFLVVMGFLELSCSWSYMAPYSLCAPAVQPFSHSALDSPQTRRGESDRRQRLGFFWYPVHWMASESVRAHHYQCSPFHPHSCSTQTWLL